MAHCIPAPGLKWRPSKKLAMTLFALFVLEERERERERGGGGLFVGCLTSQQQASVSQGRICSDNFTCCHTEIEVADQMFYLTQSQYTDTGPTSPSADPIMPGAWQGSHWSANFNLKSLVWLDPEKIPAQAGFKPGTFHSRGGHHTIRPTRRSGEGEKIKMCWEGAREDHDASIFYRILVIIFSKLIHDSVFFVFKKVTKKEMNTTDLYRSIPSYGSKAVSTSHGIFHALQCHSERKLETGTLYVCWVTAGDGTQHPARGCLCLWHGKRSLEARAGGWAKVQERNTTHHRSHNLASSRRKVSFLYTVLYTAKVHELWIWTGHSTAVAVMVWETQTYNALINCAAKTRQIVLNIL